MKRFSLIQRLFFFSRFFKVKEVRGSIGKKIFTQIWYRTWLKEGYATPEDKIIEKYQKLDPWSVDNFLLLFGIWPIGTIRFIISSNEDDLPVIKDFEVKRIWKGKKIMEITLLTVTERFQRFCHFPLLILMKRTYQYAKSNGFDGIVIAADRRLFHLLTKRFRFPCHQIGKEKMYEGSITYPAYLDLREAEELVKKINPKLYRFFTSKRAEFF